MPAFSLPAATRPFTVTTVCLPAATPTEILANTAGALVGDLNRASAGPTGHFLTNTRVRKSQLLQPHRHRAAGGPIKLLDLTSMRQHAHRTFWNRWRLWHRIVTGAPVAKPFWHFYDRHMASPKQFPLAHAQQTYLGQTRVVRMLAYNARPDRVDTLPTSHLEAFEAGPDAYATYGWLTAVPSDAMLTLDGQLLQAASGRLVDQLSYLDTANAFITAMTNKDHLVALATV